MRPRVIAIAIAVTVSVAVYCLVSRFGLSGNEHAVTGHVADDGATSTSDVDARKSVKPAKRGATKRAKPPRRTRRTPVEACVEADTAPDPDELTEEEEAFLDEIYDALTDENEAALRALDSRVRESSKKAIREEFVKTIGWFGAAFLPELSLYLVDEDEDVRDEARVQWQNAFYEIEDEHEKLAVCELAFGVIVDKEMLGEIADAFNGAEEADAVAALARIITDGRNANGVSVAKDTYESVTGEAWTGVEAAEAWLRENADGTRADTEEESPAEEETVLEGEL